MAFHIFFFGFPSISLKSSRTHIVIQIVGSKILFGGDGERSNFDRRKRVSISDFCDEWQQRVCIIHQGLVEILAFPHVRAWKVGENWKIHYN